MRPAELDLNGAQTIAVLPIKPYEYYEIREDARGMKMVVGMFFQLFDNISPEEKKCIDKLQYMLEEGLISSPYIELINSTKVSNAIKNNTSNPADVYLTGEVTYFDIDDDRIRRYEKIDDSDDEYRVVHYYKRSVQMNFAYKVVDGYSEKVISYNRITLSSESGEYEHRRDLPSGFSIIESELSKAARQILHELQPYSIMKYVKLKEDKSKNPDFKTATKLAKDGKLSEAYNSFIKIYKETGMMEAGFNAGVLLEATGKLSAAKELMSELSKNYSDSQITNALSDIQYEINKAAEFKKQTEFNDVLDTDF